MSFNMMDDAEAIAYGNERLPRAYPSPLWGGWLAQILIWASRVGVTTTEAVLVAT
jgi:hypothetical protein